MPTAEKENIIKAINALGRKVSVADVAEKTGLPLLVVSAELNKVAAEAGGHLEVSTKGDIAYKFDFGFQNAYLLKGITASVQKIMQSLFKLAFFLLRISFGVMLILSFVIVIGLVLVVIFAANRSSDRESDSSFDLSFFDWMILRDLFFWGVYDPYPYVQGYDASYRDYDKLKASRNKKERSNFLLDCFSFLFGDGNPNVYFEEKRWQMIAQAIRKNDGVITAEQLAPYTDSNPENEDGVLPVLVRFNGRPEVTNSGNLVYVFPELQVSASKSSVHNLPTYIQEDSFKFSNASFDQLLPVVGLAALNFIGSWWLLAESSRVLILYTCLPLLKALTVYGTLFVALPLVRSAVIYLLNRKIEERNNKRAQYASKTTHPDERLIQKLSEARQFALKQVTISDKDLVYTTDKDLLTQDIEQSISTNNNLPFDTKPKHN